MARDNDTSTGKFGVVIPVYNESRLALLLKKFDFTIVPHVFVVDDGSSDGSTAVAGNYPVTLLKHEKRTGVGAAIRTGLHHLKKNGFAIGVVMAGNNKDDPGDIRRVVAAVREGADYVQGSRYVIPEKAKDTPFKRRVITRGVALLWSVRFSRKLTDVTNGFRAYKLSILDDPKINLDQEWLNRYELEYYLHYKALSLGYKYGEVPVAKRYPTDGLPTSKIKLTQDYWSLLRPLVLLTLRLRS
jgi:dolichol-phosphate mannosyltransferase